ncbi:MAG: InlB B-repeat-containing protein [Anaerotardibacter sp.]
MKKLILGLLTTFCLAFAITPAMSFADTTGNADYQELQNLVDKNSTVTLEKDYTIDTRLCINNQSPVTLDLNGHTIKYENPNAKASVIEIQSEKELIINDSSESKTGTITGGTGTQTSSSFYGGGIYLYHGAKLTINGGTITGCSANLGGAIFADAYKDTSNNHYPAGTIIMNGGSISNCSAASGGAVFVSYGGQFIMNGGSITSCEVTNGNAGVVETAGEGSSFEITDGARVEGPVEISGGGNGRTSYLYAHGGIITGNVYTQNSGKVTRIITDTDADTYTTFGGSVLTTSGGVGNIDDSAKLEVTFDSNGGTEVASQYVLKSHAISEPTPEPTIEGYYFSGWYTSNNQKWDFNNDSVNENITLKAQYVQKDYTDLQNALNKGGKIVLDRDYVVNENLVVSKTVTLDLNGHTITYQNASKNNSVITVESNATLTIEDSSENKTGAITGGTGTEVGSNKGSYNGGGIYVAGGKLIMNGGNITGCSVTHDGKSGYGGGVYVDSGSFTMNGGIITNCTAAGDSTALYVGAASSFTLTGTAVVDGTIKLTSGSTMYANGGTVNEDVITNGGGAITRNAVGSDPDTYTTFLGNDTSNVPSAAKLAVTFDSNGGSKVDTQYVLKGYTVSEPSSPTWSCHTFKGWKKGSESWSFNTPVTENITLTAQWEETGTHTFTATTVKPEALKTSGNCKTEAVYYYSCKDCGKVEGNDSHTFTGEENPGIHVNAEASWNSTAEKHQQVWECCGQVVASSEGSHIWENGKCSECGYTCVHSYEWKSESGKYWQQCNYCKIETAKQVIPAVSITGADKVCVTQDYSFTAALPDGVSVESCKYNFTDKGGSINFVVADGQVSATLPASNYSTNQNTFTVCVELKTNDGFTYTAEKPVSVLANHEGGTATCVTKAKCDVCGEEYGSEDGTNHKKPLVKVPAKDATTTEQGNIEYWICGDCGACFKDQEGTTSIALADTIIKKLPVIIEGNNQTVIKGEETDLTFRSDADFNDFVRVEIDGVTLDSEHRTVREGSTVVTLNGEYVKTLQVGEHVITIVSKNGEASTTFKITEPEKEEPTNPDDSGNPDNPGNANQEGSSDNSGDSDSQKNTNGNKTEGKTPQTGDSAGLVGVIAGIACVLAMGVMVAVRARKKAL